jgi:hypothetical protein
MNCLIRGRWQLAQRAIAGSAANGLTQGGSGTKFRVNLPILTSRGARYGNLGGCSCPRR